MSRFIKTWLVFFWFAVQSTLVTADPLCWLRSESPLDTVINGSVELGPDWKTYKLLKPLKVSPHVYKIELLLKKSDFDFVDLTDSNDYPESWNRWVPRNVSTGKIHLFDVRVRNSKLGWINLVYSSSGTPALGDQAFISIGFSNHPEKNQFFYPEDSLIEEVHIRANHKVNVEQIRWTASGYWKWPCRKWSEVPASEFIMPER